MLFKFTHWKFLLRWGSHNVKELWQKTEATADAKQVTSLNTLVTDRWIFWIQLFKILSITVFWYDDRWLSPLVLGMPTAKLHVYNFILSTEVMSRINYILKQLVKLLSWCLNHNLRHYSKFKGKISIPKISWVVCDQLQIPIWNPSSTVQDVHTEVGKATFQLRLLSNVTTTYL